MEVRVETIEPMQVVFARHVGPYSEVGGTWQKLSMWAGMNGLFGPATRMVGVCHDGPSVTPTEKIRYDACITIDREIQPEGEYGVQEIAGGEFAIATHRGSYEKLGESYAAFYGQWLPSSGREPGDAPSLEVYLNSPMDTAPEDLVTEICMPLA